MGKKDLLARIFRDRGAFASLWEGLTPQQMTRRPGPQDDWSVKDLIAHVCWWETFTLERTAEVVSGEVLAWDYDVDVLNARTFEENKDRLLQDVLDQFPGNVAMIQRVVNSMDEARYDQPGAYPTDGRTLLDYIADNTYRHYPMHWDDLRSYVEKLGM
jgi:hypothetical protein